MGGATIRARRRRAATVRGRLDAARRSLTASGVVPTYDLLYGSQCGLFFAEHVREAGFREMSTLWWPTETRGLDPHFGVFREDDRGAVYRLPDGTLAHAHLNDDSIRITLAGPSREALDAAAETFRSLYPASFVNTDGDSRVPITFWTNGRFGPTPRLRRIEATTWEPIVGNYTADVRDGLADVMAWEDGPGEEGQLILWQGPPGTGKTWALRALAAEWAAWAEFNYITDPDSFFVDDPSYMIDVLLSESYMVMDSGGDVYEEQSEGKWRVLILEDTGELLSANAKERYGQGLSRLLNVVDGMIGQGLRVICLVTTNDELGDLNEAALRPGRMASQLVFGPLTDEEAQAWTGDPAATAGTIAELYGRYGKGLEAFEADGEETADALVASLDAGLAALYDLRVEVCALCGATDERPNPECDHCSPWSRKPGTMSDEPTTVEQIARVAADHQPDEPAYGETAWDAATATVLWVSWDGTSNEEAQAAEDAFLAIDGVEGFAYEAEGLPDGWWDAEVVYPENPPRWVVERRDEEAELADIVALALEPLDLEDEALLAAALEDESPDGLRDALRAIARAHETTVGAVTAAVQAHARREDGTRGDKLALAAIAALDRFARRPSPPSPQVTVNVPERETHVHVPPAERIPAPVVYVDVPEQPQQPAPHVEIVLPEQPAPIVHVAAAEAAPPTPVEVTVNVPERPAEAAVPAATPERRPSSIVVDFDAEGRKVFVPVYDDELEEDA